MVYVRFIIAVIIVLYAKFTHATSPISQVGSPVVTKGELATEARFGFTRDSRDFDDDKRLFMRQHINYGFNDWYATRFIIRQNKFNNDTVEHQLVSLENHFQFTDHNIDGFDSGMRLTYIDNHDNFAENILENRYLLQVPFMNEWQYRLHSIFNYSLADNPDNDVEFEIRNQITRKIKFLPELLKQESIGIETFHNLNKIDNSENYDDQNHQLGVLSRGNFNNHMYYQTHYRIGISDSSADHLIGFMIGKKFDL